MHAENSETVVAWEPLVCNNSHNCVFFLMTYRSVHMGLKKNQKEEG